MRDALLALIVLALAGCGSQSATSTTTSSPQPLDSDVYYGAHLPAGPQRAALQANCEICHSADMYTQQRLSKIVWNAEVTKMIKFGSPLPKAEQSTIVAYLAKYLGPTVPRDSALPSATAPPLSYSGPPPAQ